MFNFFLNKRVISQILEGLGLAFIILFIPWIFSWQILGDSRTFGYEVPYLAFVFALGVTGFLFISLSQWLSGYLKWPPKITLYALGIFFFSLGGVFLFDPSLKFNLYWVLFFMICATSFFWSRSVISDLVFRFLLFLGFLWQMGFFSFGYIDGFLPSLYLLFWFFMETSNTRNFFYLLGFVLFLTFCLWSLGIELFWGIGLIAALIVFYQNRFYFFRRYYKLWLLVFLLFSLGASFWLWKIYEVFLVYEVNFPSWKPQGLGIQQFLYAQYEASKEVVPEEKLRLPFFGFQLLWYEMGIFSLFFIASWIGILSQSTYKIVSGFFLFLALLFFPYFLYSLHFWMWIFLFLLNPFFYQGLGNKSSTKC